MDDDQIVKQAGQLLPAKAILGMPVKKVNAATLAVDHFRDAHISECWECHFLNSFRLSPACKRCISAGKASPRILKKDRLL